MWLRQQIYDKEVGGLNPGLLEGMQGKRNKEVNFCEHPKIF